MADELRRTFGGVAELYDRARPGYPPQLFDDLAELAQLRAGMRVLEIGCGTGQATLPLVQRGYTVTAVELSPDLAAVARRNLHGFSNVSIDVAAFETWQVPGDRFDAVISAQAFHWVDPSVRLARVYDVLAPNGALALFGHRHVGGGDRPFFVAVQDCYERYMPGTPPGLRLANADDLAYDDWGFLESGLFEPPAQRRYPFEVEYTTAEYLDVLDTYSGHIALSPSDHAALFDCIRRLIDEQFGGRIRKAYVTELAIARKLG